MFGALHTGHFKKERHALFSSSRIFMRGHHRIALTMPFELSRRSRWTVVTILLLLSSTITVDQLQRHPGGTQLPASTQQWQLDDDAFILDPASLRLLPSAQSTLITGSLSRKLEASEDTLPPGELLELQLPQWRERSVEQTLTKALPIAQTLQEHMVREALQHAIDAAQPPSKTELTNEQAQALHWLSFRDRQFIAQLTPQHGFDIRASLGQKPLTVRSVDSSGQLLLNVDVRGKYVWSDGAFSSTDDGASWQFAPQREQPSEIDQQGWVNARTGFIWHSLEQALLITTDGGSTWATPHVITPLPSAAAAVDDAEDLPASLSASQYRLPSFAPAIWSDIQPPQPTQTRFEFLFQTLPAGRVLGWSSRWERRLDANNTPTGEWKATLTRRFSLEIDPANNTVKVLGLKPEKELQPIDNTTRWPVTRNPDGSMTLWREASVQYFDPETEHWQVPVALPLPLLHRGVGHNKFWATPDIWISQSQAPALLDMFACLLPETMPLQARCNEERARAYAFSRDQGRSWQHFQLPNAMHSHIVGWDAQAQQLLVAQQLQDAQPLQLLHYRLVP